MEKYASGLQPGDVILGSKGGKAHVLGVVRMASGVCVDLSTEFGAVEITYVPTEKVEVKE